jgi:hypothetical protein
MNVSYLQIEDVSDGCGQKFSLIVVSPDFEGICTVYPSLLTLTYRHVITGETAEGTCVSERGDSIDPRDPVEDLDTQAVRNQEAGF